MPGAQCFLTLSGLGLDGLWLGLNDTALSSKPISELWSITCYMGSHSITCHPAQVNALFRNSSQLDLSSFVG